MVCSLVELVSSPLDLTTKEISLTMNMVVVVPRVRRRGSHLSLWPNYYTMVIYVCRVGTKANA